MTVYRDDDPPDYPEPPEWYMALEDALGLDPPEKVVEAVRKAMSDWEQEEIAGNDIGPPDLPDEELPEHGCWTCGKPTDCIYCSAECTPPCVHGSKQGECDHCDHLADMAYDAARESKS